MSEKILARSSAAVASASATAEPPRALAASRRWAPLRRLRTNRLVVLGAVLTIVIVLVALLANRLAPYDPIALNARHRLEAPSAAELKRREKLKREEP